MCTFCDEHPTVTIICLHNCYATNCILKQLNYNIWFRVQLTALEVGYIAKTNVDGSDAPAADSDNLASNSEPYGRHY